MTRSPKGIFAARAMISVRHPRQQLAYLQGYISFASGWKRLHTVLQRKCCDWHEADLKRCPLTGSYGAESGYRAAALNALDLTRI